MRQEMKLRLTFEEQEQLRRAAGIENVPLATWIRQVALLRARDVIQDFETDLRIAAERKRSQKEYMDGVGRQCARSRGYGSG
jgi:uncharacterized protein (DUF1778 family)